ncbi:MAG: cbb3-type cytochrome c oxidase N-terminal domain-containing protein [Bacteroidota bacterium]
MKRSCKFFIYAIGVLLLAPVAGVGQEAVPEARMSAAEQYVVWGLMALEVLLLLVTVTLLVVVKVLGSTLFPRAEVEVSTSGKLVEPPTPWYQKLLTKMNDAVPIEREAEVLTTHEYDGIYELDNNLPPWWKAMFYVTIVFGVVYLLYFHVLQLGAFQEEEYEQEMAQAKIEIEAYLATANTIDETNVTIISDEARISAAQTAYVQKCSPCHGAAGEGGVGPNLTDNYWIHGGDVKDIFRVIKNGVPEKGMIPWKAQLTPAEMQDLASFIITLEGTNPPNGKEPQGELYERSEEMALK